jgi:two-component system sensor histidine kinase AlgZ
MHPIFRQRIGLALYVLGWLLAGVVIAQVIRLVVPQPPRFAHAVFVPTTLVLGFAVMSAWWVCRANPLAEGRVGRALGAQANAAIQVTAVWTAVTLGWGVAVSRLAPVPDARAILLGEWFLVFAIGIPVYLLSAVIHYLALAFEAAHDAERRVLESEVAAREAELRALHAQLNPHFLFNSLNSINALVGTDPEGARRMCEGLGDFLRRTLALGARDDVALGEELELVDRYLAIEQVRFGDRLRIERGLEPGVDACRVPPLLLQPLVENAVKHGISGCLEGGTVRIDAHRRDGSLVLEVSNPVDPDATPRAGSGLGLENVRRRLQAFGARAARLDAGPVDGGYRVRLVLPAGSGEDAGS